MRSLTIFLPLFILAILLNNGCSQPAEKQTKKVSTAKLVKSDHMDNQEFWKIINYSADVANGDLKQQEQIIVEKLSEYTPQQIIDFEQLFCKKIIVANDYKIQAAEKIIEGSVIDDDYLYFRCWLIAQGQKTFEKTLQDPDYLANTIVKGSETNFEALLYVSTKAYKNKTGKTTEDNSFPRDVAFSKGLNYDFGAPKTTGTDWKEDELPQLYPKLWNKFN